MQGTSCGGAFPVCISRAHCLDKVACDPLPLEAQKTTTEKEDFLTPNLRYFKLEVFGSNKAFFSKCFRQEINLGSPNVPLEETLCLH